MANWYQKTGDEVLKEFGVTTDGLSRQKAEELLHSHGENVLAEGKKKTVLLLQRQTFSAGQAVYLCRAARMKKVCRRWMRW